VGKACYRCPYKKWGWFVRSLLNCLFDCLRISRKNAAQVCYHPVSFEGSLITAGVWSPCKKLEPRMTVWLHMQGGKSCGHFAQDWREISAKPSSGRIKLPNRFCPSLRQIDTRSSGEWHSAVSKQVHTRRCTPAGVPKATARPAHGHWGR